MFLMKIRPLVGAAFLALCLMSQAGAKPSADFPERNDEEFPIDFTFLETENDENVKTIVEALEVLLYNSTSPQMPESERRVRLLRKLKETGITCRCEQKRCDCCHQLDVFGLTVSSCISVTHYHDSGEMQIEVTVLGRVVYAHSISVRHPPVPCFDVGFIVWGGKLCAQFYNLQLSGGRFGGCAKILGYWFSARVLNIDIGCFDMPNLKNGAEVQNQFLAETEFLNEKDASVREIEFVDFLQQLVLLDKKKSPFQK